MVESECGGDRTGLQHADLAGAAAAAGAAPASESGARIGIGGQGDLSALVIGFRTICASSGITVDADISTTSGNLALDGDADNDAGAGDTITFDTGRVLTAAGSLTLDATSAGSGITGAVLTLNSNDGITINNNLATTGDLTIDADQDAGDNNGTLTVATGATV